MPSGVWEETEYAKLPEYDRETAHQPTGVFLCHQQDGRACAGWCAVHDMQHSLALRLAAAVGMVEDVDAFLEYETDVPVFATGAEAAEHGLAAVERPPAEAVRMIRKLERRRGR